MTRQQLEHIIRAAASVSDSREIVIVGSQSILGTFPNDLAVSKLAAGREKDLEYVRVMLREGLADRDVVRHRLSQTPRVPPEAQERLTRWLDAA